MTSNHEVRRAPCMCQCWLEKRVCPEEMKGVTLESLSEGGRSDIFTVSCSSVQSD